jgi:hypothetical protein
MGRDINKALRNMKDVWEQTEAKEGGGRVPDDDYLADIKVMELSFSSSGRLQVNTTFEIYEGDEKGSTIRRFDGLDNDTSMAYFKGYCAQIGLDAPEDIEELPDALKEFVDSNEDKFDITVKTINDFQNVYVTGVNDSDGTSGESGEGEETDLEDMDKKELKAYAKEQDIKIKGISKLDEDELREAIEEAIEERNESGEEIDLDDLDEDELLAFAKENKLKIKGIKKMDEEEIREAIQEAMEEAD